MTEKEKLKIRIFNKEYALLVENQSIAKELAVYVSDIMEETRKDLGDQNTETVAVIAALNIAYDLFIEKNNSREFAIQATDRIKKIKLILNESDNISNPS